MHLPNQQVARWSIGLLIGLGGAATSAHPAHAALLDSTTTPLGTAVADIAAPVVQPVVNDVAPIVNPIVAPIVNTTQPIVGTVGTTVNPIVNPTVAPIVAPIVRPIVNTTQPITAPVTNPISGVVAPVAGPIVQTINPIVAPITGLLGTNPNSSGTAPAGTNLVGSLPALISRVTPAARVGAAPSATNAPLGIGVTTPGASLPTDLSASQPIQQTNEELIASGGRSLLSKNTNNNAGQIAHEVLSPLRQTARDEAVPLAIGMVMALFLLIQGRLDRNDDKLTHAPMRGESGVTFQ